MIDSKPIRSVVPSHPVAMRRTLHAIAAFEAIKGLAAFAVVVGVRLAFSACSSNELETYSCMTLAVEWFDLLVPEPHKS
jgi:hypothetical protein